MFGVGSWRIVRHRTPVLTDCPQGRFRFPSVAVGASIFYINSILVVVSMFGSRCYLIFSNANVATARIRPTSQKRVTIFASGTGCDGHLIFAGMSIFW